MQRPCGPFPIWGNSPREGQGLVRGHGVGSGQSRAMWELAVYSTPCSHHLSLNGSPRDPSQHLGHPAQGLSTLMGVGRGRLMLPSPAFPAGSKAGSNQWGVSEGREGDPPSGPTPPAPSLRGWQRRPQTQSRGPGLEHHLSALCGGSGGLVSMATVQCEGILASLGSALSSINRGCSRLHAYYEQSRALSTGNYA